MELTNHDADRLTRSGVHALQNGRPAEARQCFEAITQSGRANAQIWLLLAVACRADLDTMAEEATLDRLLALEPHAVRGLIMKGDCRAAANDKRSALRHYEIALRVAAEQDLPEDLLLEIRRADAWVTAFKEHIVQRREAALIKRGWPADRRSARFQQSIDILAGRKRIFVQEPTGYYFPELPNIQFYDRTLFDWVPMIEAASASIKAELISLLGDGVASFRPYIQSEPGYARANPLLDNRDWSALFLCENGRLSDDLIARCPATWRAVQAAPLPYMANSPTVMFSLLRSGARIIPHTGAHNARLTCHLPLIVPPDCRFRVGNDVREWEEGKVMIFDDTIEHEAWNDSDEDRFVLIFDIWRPELTAQERDEVAAVLLGAIDD